MTFHFKLFKQTLLFIIFAYKVCDVSEYYYMMFAFLIISISVCDLKCYQKKNDKRQSGYTALQVFTFYLGVGRSQSQIKFLSKESRGELKKGQNANACNQWTTQKQRSELASTVSAMLERSLLTGMCPLSIIWLCLNSVPRWTVWVLLCDLIKHQPR